MDALKVQLQKIQQQLTGLSASQKMLTASLIAIMAITIVYWARYAGTAELVPVLEQSLSTAQLGQIKNSLDARGIPATLSGDKILVPSDRRSEALVTLTYDNAMPDDAANVWDEVMKQMSPWDPKQKTDSIQNHLREQLLSQALSRYIPGISKANVLINPVSERRIGNSLEPSASVQIQTRGRDFNAKRIAEAAAMTVSYAVSGLTRQHVSVLVNGLPVRIQDENNLIASGEVYEQIDAEEKRISDKISALFPGTGALVAVTVDVNTVSRDEVQEVFDPTKTVSKERTIETDTQESSMPPAQSADPGVGANTSLSLGAPAAAANNATSTTEKNRTEMENFIGKTTSKVVTPAGKATVLSAAVRLPRSYFIQRFKALNPTAKEPDDNALVQLAKEELPGVRNLVKTLAVLKADDAVSVDMYYDGASPVLGDADAALASGGTSGSMSAMVGGHIRELAVVALAVLSLFMVSMIVKKGAPAPVVAAPSSPRETPRLASAEDIAGIVGDGNPTLDGMELDEDAIQAHQMVEQVQTMVKENPDAAANLVKRWLNRS